MSFYGEFEEWFDRHPNWDGTCNENVWATCPRGDFFLLLEGTPDSSPVYADFVLFCAQQIWGLLSDVGKAVMQDYIRGLEHSPRFSEASQEAMAAARRNVVDQVEWNSACLVTICHPMARHSAIQAAHHVMGARSEDSVELAAKQAAWLREHFPWPGDKIDDD